jgi:dTDP-4-amino-4,6-dideoxygalactose transaminase
MKIPDGCESNYHIFYLMFKDEAIRNSIKNKLIAQGIIALTHFVPLHSSPMGHGLGYKQGDLKKTEMAGRCLLRLPLYADLSEDDMHFVGEKLADILEGL